MIEIYMHIRGEYIIRIYARTSKLLHRFSTFKWFGNDNVNAFHVMIVNILNQLIIYEFQGFTSRVTTIKGVYLALIKDLGMR